MPSKQPSTDGDADFSALIATLELLRTGMTGEAPPAAANLPAQTAFVVQSSVAEENREVIPPANMAATFIATESPLSDTAEARTSAVSDSSIRVDVGLLDKLMTLVGELVLARNQVMQFSASQEDAAFLGTVQRLNLLTTELQAGVMKTRMQPINTIWSKFPRVVRDLALGCGKQVRLEMEGQETELDKTIIEAIRDPLTHLVAQCHRPRHRAPRGPTGAWQAGRRPAGAARLPRGGQGQHRDCRRRRRASTPSASAPRPSRPS